MENNFIDWYECNALPYQIIQQYAQKQSNCYVSVNNLINYTFEYGENKQPVPNPNVHFYNININDSYNGDRIWNIVFGGTTNNAIYSCIFQFDPNCSVPNGKDNAKFSQINFNQNGKNLLEYFQGYIVINDVIVGISGPGPTPQSEFEIDPLYNVVNLRWNAKQAQLILNINLGNATVGWAKLFNPPLPPPDPTDPKIIDARLSKQFNWQIKFPNTYFVNIWVRDTVNIGFGGW